jgi:NAD(P)-dependent dehydrogenase (short-subunit alcohol dehydrogenase family)
MDSKQKRLHGLVNNAGIMAVANGISEDGFEYQWQVRRFDLLRETYSLLTVSNRQIIFRTGCSPSS